MQGDIGRTFRRNLLDLVGENKTAPRFFRRVIMSPMTCKKRNGYLRRLLHMNIHQASLFPDFDGFAKSFQRHLAYPDLKGWLEDPS